MASKFDKLRLNGWEQQQQQQQQHQLVNGAKMKDNGHRHPPPPPPGHRQQQQLQQQQQREDEAIQRRRRQQQEEEEEQRGRRARGGRDEADRAVPQEDLDQGDEILRYKETKLVVLGLFFTLDLNPSSLDAESHYLSFCPFPSPGP